MGLGDLAGRLALDEDQEVDRGVLAQGLVDLRGGGAPEGHLAAGILQQVLVPGLRGRPVCGDPLDRHLGGDQRAHDPAHAVAEDDDVVAVHEVRRPRGP